MRRRRFITLLGGVAAWPLVARAQQGGLVKRLGILAGSVDERISALREELQKLGWIEGRNLRIDLRSSLGDPDRIRTYAAELVTLAPDVIVTTSRATTAAVQDLTKTIPIIFTAGLGPIQGVQQSIARPEGNVTGFA